MEVGATGTGLLSSLAETLERVRATTRRTAKRAAIIEYLDSLADADLPLAVTFLSGRPFPRAQNRRLSIGGSTLSAALLAANPALAPETLHAAWLTHSDAGDAAADVWGEGSHRGEPLTLSSVAGIFESLAAARGPTEKAPILAEAFRRMDSREIRAFVKVMLSETRAGLQEGTLEDAVAAAFGRTLEEIRAANRHRADLGSVALDARRGSLRDHAFAYFTPVDPMLAHPTTGSEEVIRRLAAPIWVEDKYDGVRCQLHKAGPVVRLYSRDRKEITRQFPEVVEAFSAGEGSVVLDGELMALENGRSLPFARLQQRLNRVAPTPEVVAAHPVALVAFDLLAAGEDSLLDAPLRERRKRLESVALPPGQQLASLFMAESIAELDRLFEEAQNLRGNEGLMCKDPDSPYASGRRGYQWLKVKRPLETLDVVIIGAEWGHGRRRAVLSDYTFAVIDDRPGAASSDSPLPPLASIGKAYGGLTDARIREMTERLQAITSRDFGRYRSVLPEIVIEVEFNGIQQSARHKSGYALRFPRIVRIRDDKRPAEINRLSDVERMYRRLVGQA